MAAAPEKKKIPQVAAAPSPAAAAPPARDRKDDEAPKPKVKNVKYELVEDWHENFAEKTIGCVVRCECKVINEIKLPIESATRSGTLGTTTSFVVSYRLKHARPTCGVCNGRFVSGE